MRPWLARVLALAFAAAAIYLVVLRVHSPSAVLEAALGATILCILSIALLWRVPSIAAVVNACCAIAGFIAGFTLGGHGSLLPGAPAGSPPQVSPAQADKAATQFVPEHYELPALAKSLPTIDAAFAFVRDKIRFESYSGILRGAQGTLDARAGNAGDRAMLLAGILQTNKIPVRLVTGQLPPEQAERLFNRIFETDTPASPPASVSTQADDLKNRVFARGRRDYNVIVSALGNNLPAITLPSHDDVIKEIEQHAWVQAQRNGQWIDLDPSFRDSSVGKTYATVAQSYDSPPAALMQKVTIRVVAETLDSGSLNKDVVLESSMPAFELLNSEVLLTHQVYQPFNGQGGELQFIFGNKDTMQPILVIDGNSTEGKPINYAAGASPAGAAAPNAVQAAANAFGTAPPHGPTGPVFVAEWLEFQIDYPDGHSETTRRVLIDRGGAAWRRSGSLDATRLTDLARNKDGLIAPTTVYNIWFSAGQHDLYAFSNSVRAVLRGTTPAGGSALASVGGEAWSIAVRDLSWFVASDGVIVPSLNDTPGVRFYADSPRIFVWGYGLDPTGKSRQFVIESDLRRDTLRGIARDATGASAVIQHKLLFGALEGALEHEMSVPPNPDASTTFVTTSSLGDSGSVVVLGPGTNATARAADTETQARLQAALATGDTLVVPKQVLDGGTPGWWQISRTGDVRAVLEEDIDGGKTIGGYTNGKPVSANWTPKGNPIQGPIGEPEVPYLPQSSAYYNTLVKPKPTKGVEFQEYWATRLVEFLSSPTFKLIAASIVSVGTWSYVIFWLADNLPQ